MPISLTPDRQDALREVVNVGVGRAAASLSELLCERIELFIPSVCLYTMQELPRTDVCRNCESSTAIVQEFSGKMVGRALLVFSEAAGRKLAQVLAGPGALSEETDLDLQGVLIEVGNIVLNGVLGALANAMGTQLSYSIPICASGSPFESLLDVRRTASKNQERGALVTATHFSAVERNIGGSLLTILGLEGLENLLAVLDPVLATS